MRCVYLTCVEVGQSKCKKPRIGRCSLGWVGFMRGGAIADTRAIGA